MTTYQHISWEYPYDSQLNLTPPGKRLQTMPFLTQEPWVYAWGVPRCRLPQCHLDLQEVLLLLFCVSKEMRLNVILCWVSGWWCMFMLPVCGLHVCTFLPDPFIVYSFDRNIPGVMVR